MPEVCAYPTPREAVTSVTSRDNSAARHCSSSRGPPPCLLPARGPRASPLRLRGCERAWACAVRAYRVCFSRGSA
ncbi:hypothetical protein NDU88_006849 [Pleurodeles waltl]|uniref:Uncharacterized protein n=1 Tax=Pleurodeles waltl TaxID=8319 RepID=A0AAV7QJZ8_PLEWA|nr:hypothetical protein NDU88_006849 [Pleurodeles waltl]